MSKSVLPMFSSKSFIVSSLIFRSFETSYDSLLPASVCGDSESGSSVSPAGILDGFLLSCTGTIMG